MEDPTIPPPITATCFLDLLCEGAQVAKKALAAVSFIAVLRVRCVGLFMTIYIHRKHNVRSHGLFYYPLFRYPLVIYRQIY